MKQVVGISEIVLWTADKERALQFYRDLIGLEVISPATLANTFLRVGEGNAGIPQMIVLVPKSDEVKAKPFGYQLHHVRNPPRRTGQACSQEWASLLTSLSHQSSSSEEG
jgi:catechol 2,3-dioxygenase-like lactoylglutathione lyase family enzyme